MEKTKPEWHLIQENKSRDIDKLFDVYKKDPKKARVLFFNDRSKYTSTRVVLFKRENEDFEIAYFKKIVGISVTNKIYKREIKVSSLIYKNKKFYLFDSGRSSKKLTQLTYSGLHSFISKFCNWGEIDNHSIIRSLTKKFSWIRFIGEEKLLHGVSFNTITRYKLYSLNDALKHKLKVNIKELKNIRLLFKGYAAHDIYKIWKEMKGSLINFENAKPELLGNYLFMDTCKMARTLEKKVNCKWSLKRLEQEHDDWSKEITNTVLEFEEEYNLKIADIFIKFGETYNYKILKTNKEMLFEGMTQNHCVGTYISKVNNHGCAIYHIDGYTLELQFTNIFLNGIRTKNKYILNVQFRGKFNSNAPKLLFNSVSEKINEFNLALAKNHYKCDTDITIINSVNNIQDNENLYFGDIVLEGDEVFPF